MLACVVRAYPRRKIFENMDQSGTVQRSLTTDKMFQQIHSGTSCGARVQDPQGCPSFGARDRNGSLLALKHLGSQYPDALSEAVTTVSDGLQRLNIASGDGTSDLS